MCLFEKLRPAMDDFTRLLRTCYILDVNGQQRTIQEDLVLASLALFFGGKLFFTSGSRCDAV